MSAMGPAGVNPPSAHGRPPLPIRSICLITKDYPPDVPGGIPRAVQMQAHMLAAAGVEVHVITKSPTGAEQLREDRGVAVHEIPEPALEGPSALYWFEIPLWSFVAATKFAQLDAMVGFDIVEAPDYRGEALQLDPRPETAVIVWLHSPMMVAWECDPDFAMTPGARAWHALEMAATERADLLLAPSELLRETTARYLGERMRPAELMPYLFDSSQFPVLRADRPHGKIRALFYGRLEPRKSPELALHAVAAARARGLDVELTMLGRNNGEYRERVLDPLQRELGLQNVTYLPHADLPGLRAVLAESDVAILASRFDNSPLTIFEALSSGVPVITSDRVGTSSWFEREDGLLALPIDDAAEFAAAAAGAMADERWMATGPRAAVRMRTDFSPAVVTERLLDCYGRVMATRPRPAQTIPEPDRAEAVSAPVQPISVAAVEGARAHAVLAFGEEIVADPSLLCAWAAVFDAHDDITLVIRTPDWSVEETERRLAPLVVQAGLDGEQSADLLALAAPAGSAAEAQLANGCRAVLSRCHAPEPFATTPTLDERSLLRLREELAAARTPTTAVGRM